MVQVVGNGIKPGNPEITGNPIWRAVAFSGPVTEDQIAGTARMTQEQVKAGLEALVEQGLVTPALIGSSPELRYKLLEGYDHDASADDLKK
jgi:hypothetical protein